MAAARDNEIGRCRCPVCGSGSARLRVSIKQLAYVMCDACNAQTFARSDRSDEKLRQLLIAEEPAPAPPPPLAVDVKPAPAPPVIEPTSKPAEDAPSWGAMSWTR